VDAIGLNLGNDGVEDDGEGFGGILRRAIAGAVAAVESGGCARGGSRFERGWGSSS